MPKEQPEQTMASYPLLTLYSPLHLSNFAASAISGTLPTRRQIQCNSVRCKKLHPEHPWYLHTFGNGAGSSRHAMGHTGPERRIRKVYVTRNTEYHLRRDLCIAVRRRIPDFMPALPETSSVRSAGKGKPNRYTGTITKRASLWSLCGLHGRPPNSDPNN